MKSTKCILLTALAVFFSIFSLTQAFAFDKAKEQTVALVKTYYDALNKKDMNLFFSIMSNDVIHDINQGASETGITKFKTYMKKTNNSFDENLSEILIMVSNDGKHAAAQWVDHGVYYKDYPGMKIHATNQKFTLNGGHFFEIHDGKLSRVTTYYNDTNFMEQIKNG